MYYIQEDSHENTFLEAFWLFRCKISQTTNQDGLSTLVNQEVTDFYFLAVTSVRPPNAWSNQCSVETGAGACHIGDDVCFMVRPSVQFRDVILEVIAKLILPLMTMDVRTKCTPS
jgi:hypothetical protein